MLRRICLSQAILLLFLPVMLRAQQSLGGIVGTVSDPSGAVIGNARITITSADTNGVTRTTSGANGYYEANFLNPGRYTILVEADGFKKSLRKDIEVSVAGRVEANLQLELGQTAETIEVTAQAPLLDTTSASSSRVIDNRQIMQLPISDLNPFALATLAPGMISTGQPEYVRPFDNGGTSGFTTAGGVGSNEYTVDGASVTGTGRRVGFNPPADAVEEFRLESSPFDASYGFTAGATVNVNSKSGANKFHGSLFNQHWQQRWNATPHFTRLAYEEGIRTGRIKEGTEKQASGRSNNYGATLGGPVLIPKIYNGRDKFFFFLTYNGIRQSKAETTDEINKTVPKMAWRQGDFSDLLAIDPVRYQIYDPRSARMVNGRVIRDPFPGNKGIPVLNPMYKFYADLYPVPNDVPGVVNAEGINNYYATAMPKNEKFYSVVNRYDYVVSDRHRLFGRWFYNDRLADEYDWTYETMRGLHSNGLVRRNKGGGLDYIWTLSNSTVLNAAVTWQRFSEGSDSPVRTQFKPSDVGLPAYLDARAGDFAMLPSLDFQSIRDFGDSYPAIGSRGSTGEARVQLTSVLGRHSLKYGYNHRIYQFAGQGPGHSASRYTFNNNWTRQADNTNNQSNTGLEWAAFMMGMPSGITIDTNDTSFFSTPYKALYLHDDIRVNRKLHLGLGLRWEHGGGTRERFNRGIGGGFDFNQQYPFSAGAAALYAANPIPELPVSAFSTLGGVNYLGQPSETWTKGAHTFMPRLSMVYQLTPKTVIRTGWGKWYDIFNVNNDRPGQDGYNQATNTVLTNDNGLTFCCGVGPAANLMASNTPLSNPFPNGFQEPFGNELGGLIRAGRGFTIREENFVPAVQQRWRFGIQQELTQSMVVEVAYNGSFSRFQMQPRLNALPAQYWSTGNVRNQANDDYLNAQLPNNPFNVRNIPGLQDAVSPTAWNYMLTQGFFTSQTIRRHSLLRPYPQMGGDFNGIPNGGDFNDYRGMNIYNDLTLQLERRYAKGFTTSVMYSKQWSSESDFYQNQFDTAPTLRPNNDARPHRFVWSAIYELPFGKGRAFAHEGFLQHIVGGWNTSWIYQYQSGPAAGWGNRFFYGNMDQLESLLNHEEVNSKDIHRWFSNAAVYGGPNDPSNRGNTPVPADFVGFEGRSNFQPGEYHVRAFPTRLNSIREDGINKWDVKVERQFKMGESATTRFSVDLLNALNRTNFGGPNMDPTNTNFGKVTSQRGPSRIIQLNLRIMF